MGGPCPYQDGHGGLGDLRGLQRVVRPFYASGRSCCPDVGGLSLGGGVAYFQFARKGPLPSQETSASLLRVSWGLGGLAWVYHLQSGIHGFQRVDGCGFAAP